MAATVPRFRVLSLVLASGVSACGGRPTEPAIVVFRSDTAEVTLPEQVRAGEPFVVSYSVFVSGCSGDTVRTGVRVRGRTAEIRPRRGAAGPGPCPAVLSIERRTETLRFEEPGEAVVSLVALREGPPEDSAGHTYTRPIRLERRLRVLPAAR